MKPGHKLGYPWTQVEKLLTEEEFERFKTWITGQTMALDEGEVVVYSDDFEHWYEMKDEEEEPYVYD